LGSGWHWHSWDLKREEGIWDSCNYGRINAIQWSSQLWGQISEFSYISLKIMSILPFIHNSITYSHINVNTFQKMFGQYRGPRRPEMLTH
jgi:hypothetical protein